MESSEPSDALDLAALEAELPVSDLNYESEVPKSTSPSASFIAELNATNNWRTLRPAALSVLAHLGVSAAIDDEGFYHLPFHLFSQLSHPDASSSTPLTLAVPANRHSPAALQFLGLERKVALRVWKHYLHVCHVCPDMPNDPMDYACLHLNPHWDWKTWDYNPPSDGLAGKEDDSDVEIDDADIEDDWSNVRVGCDPDSDAEWDAQMRSLGVTASLRAAILSPGHDAVRDRRSARDWVTRTFEERWEWLESLNDRILAFVCKQPVDAAPTGRNRASSDPTPSPSLRTPTAPLTNDMQAPAGVALLYRGDSFIKQSEIRPYHAISSCWSHPMAQRDFDIADQPSVYLTPQRQVAELYARYALARNREVGMGGAVMVYAVPTGELPEAYLLDGKEGREEWKDVVRAGRELRRVTRDEDERTAWTEQSKEIRDALKGWGLLVGPVCGLSQRALRWVDSEEGGDEMDEEWGPMMVEDGKGGEEPAMQ